MTLTALKISYLEQLNSKIFAWLSTMFSRLKIEHLIKQIGIRRAKVQTKGHRKGPLVTLFCLQPDKGLWI
ncbi:hypothetical protein [Pseudoalteromonas rubra]|uniref:hypothetical protein n=1 Tax=Pseudoalteromonas rubra TaxID=43658 RepID=UPI00026CB6FD|nr:hypothetical protein [Pseudoalteromonas rubra]